MTRSLQFICTICCAATVSLLIVGCQKKTTDNVDTSSPTVEGSTGNASADDESTENASADNTSADNTSADNASAKNTSTDEQSDATTETSTNAAANTGVKPNGNGKEDVITGDWPMWGGTINRNMINGTTGISLDFDPETNKNIKWTAKLGSQTYGNPVVSGGKILVGTNNGAEYRPKHKGDRGCVLCIDEKTGKFLWQLTREKLPAGRVNDWPLQGICSSSCIEGDRAWVVTNRCELMCVDMEGMYDGENDGPYTQEVDTEEQDADIVWALDMMEQLGVFPHNLATSSPVVYGDNVYIVTSNGVDEAHLEIPSPRAPSFICVNKKTGEVVWEDSSPDGNILHGQWSSPAVGEVNGKALVFFPGGDGWLYAFDAAAGGEPVWKFDLNPKDAKYELGTKGTRNECIATPVFVENSVVVAVGQDPEHGEGVGHLYRIDATKTGDVSAELDADGDGVGEPNPNSGMIWHYGGADADGSVTGTAGEDIFRRTIATVAVHNDIVYAADLSGFLHCVDFKSGKRYWVHDMLAAIWGSPMVADGKVFLGDEDGDLVIMEEGTTKKVLDEKVFPSQLYCTVTIANGVMYIAERARLYAIPIK